MNLVWSQRSWSEYLFWQDTDPKLVQKINDLIKDAMRSPFSELGKPEPLKNQLRGFWSRRISNEHRMVYRVVAVGTQQALEIASCRFHYGN